MKAGVVYTLMLLAVVGFFLLTKSPNDLRKSVRSSRKHGPHLQLNKGDLNMELGHISFDPMIAGIEQKREDASWERTQGHKLDAGEKAVHPAAGIDDFLDHHLEGTPDPDFDSDYDDDYIHYLEDGFNFTARIEQLFPEVDRDKNGVISLEEMWAWHRELAKNQSLHRSDREMSGIAKAEDGRVTLQEYLHDPNEGTDGAQEWPEHNQHWADTSRRKFPLADRNGDGKLDRSEFDDFLHPEDSDNKQLHQFLRKEEIRERDADGDGKLSFAEFLGGMYDALRDLRVDEEEDARLSGPRHHPEGPGADVDDRQRWSGIKHRRDYLQEQSAVADRRIERARKRFDELDRDKDGFLNEDELLPVMERLNPGESYYARLQAESLLKLADDDRNGELSLQEMLNHKHSFYRTIDEDDEIFIHDEF